MHKKQPPLIIILIITLLLTACTTTTDDRWPAIQASGTLRVGLDPNYPPFELLTDDGYHGFDIDLAHALGQQLNLTPQFVPISYDGLYDALLTNQVDVLISALVIFPERTREVAYSQPYFDAGQVLIMPHNANITIEPYNGQTLAVELATQGHVIANDWARTNPNLTITTYPTPDETIAAVAAGDAPAAITDAITAYLALPNHPTLTIHPTTLQPDPYVIVTRRQDEQLLTQINQALTTLHTNGTLTQLRQKHTLTLPPPP